MDKIIYVDGGSKGNPGQGYGSWKFEGAKEVNRLEFPGITTNNEAEYMTLITALKTINELGIKNVTIYMDSMLVVKQVGRGWQVNAPGLVNLNALAIELIRENGGNIVWRPRSVIFQELGH